MLSNFIFLWALGAPEIIIIAIVILLLFGGSKIPQLMKGIGQGISEFKKASKGEAKDEISPAGN